MRSKRTNLSYLLAPLIVAHVACAAANPDDDTGERDDRSALPQPARMSCGNMPILIGDYRTRPAPADCVACMDASCCAQAEACAADEACKARAECHGKCGYDYACRIRCDADHPSTPLGEELAACRGASCPECHGIDLSCVGEPLPESTTATRRVRFRFVFFGAASTPYDNTRVRVCKADDVECTAPLSEATTDAEGWVELELPTGPAAFSAYLELTGLAIAPTLLFPRWFDLRAIPDSLGYTPLDLPTFNALRSGLGAPDDPERGVIVTSVRSCGFVTMAGMTLASSQADATTIQVYDENNFPSATATRTDGKGVGGHFANHPAGITTLTATKAETGERYGSLDVVVRGGFFTMVGGIPPSP